MFYDPPHYLNRVIKFVEINKVPVCNRHLFYLFVFNSKNCDYYKRHKIENK